MILQLDSGQCRVPRARHDPAHVQLHGGMHSAASSHCSDTGRGIKEAQGRSHAHPEALPLSVQEEKKVPPPIPKKPPRSKVHPVKERSLDSMDRQRQEARKRLLAAKRAASFRQNSATESADSIEIYIPEAQTRL